MTRVSAGILLAACVLMPGAASAQTPQTPRAPAPGELAPAAVGTSSAVVSFEVAEAYDDNLLADQNSVSASQVPVSGFYTMFNPRLKYQSSGSRFQVALNADTNARYYRDALGFQATASAVGAGVTARLGSRTSASLNQGVTYSPAYLYGLFADATPAAPGDAVPPAADYKVATPNSMAYLTTGSLTRKTSARTSFLFNGEYNVSNFEGGAASLYDLTTATVGGKFDHAVSSNLTWNVAYTYRRAEYSGSFTSDEQHPTLGFSYKHPVSATRSTLFSAKVGPRILSGALGVGSVNEELRHGVSGDASISHQIGHTWTVTGAYRRGVDFLEGILQPIDTDGVTAAASGYVNRRATLSFQASVSNGDATAGGAVVTATTGANMAIALNRHAALTLGYLFYYYDFGNIVLAPGLPPNLKRNSARVGFTLFAPTRR